MKCKRFFASGAAAILILALASGCSGSNVDPKVESGAEQEQQNLRIYLSTGNMPETFDLIHEKFREAHPEVNLEIEPMPPSNEVETILKTKAATDELPDIFNMWSQVELWAPEGLLMDLTDKPYMQDFMEEAFAVNATYEGRKYVFPLNFAPVGIYYNKDMFEQYGLEVPTTWSAFLNVCQVLKDNEIVPIAMPYKDSWTAPMVIHQCAPEMLYTQKPNFDADVKAGKDTYQNDQWKAMMEKYLVLRDSGYINEDALGISVDQSYMMLAKNQAAMTMNGSWALPAIRAMSGDIQYGMFPLPCSEDPDNVRALSTMETGLSVSKNTPNEDAVDKYLSFLASEEIYKIYLEGNKGLSTQKSISVAGDEMFSLMAEYSQAGKAHDYITFDANLTPDLFRKLMQQLFMGEVTYDQVLEEMQKDQDRAIAER